ncbi:MAG: methylmalonyl-CoA carboxyltransferase, partial [Actinobacteria bacterium]|nr:methylmalonyl-CoA carboxyltransferase [Actinomycetota bacterium]
MTWEPEIEELRRREELARLMGGPEKLERQRAAGRLNVRERMATLLDEGSFHEIGALTGRATYDESGALVEMRPANFVMGRGRIDGRAVVVGGDDFTVRGGAADAAIFQKQVYAERMAHDLRMPLVRLIDGTGGGGSVKSLEEMGRTYVPFNPGWEWIVANLAEVPVVSLALGPVAGLGAARFVSSHYAVMVKDVAQVFVAGPPVVARLGEVVDKEGLGGARIHGRNGVADDVAESEKEAFERTRRFLSFLPPSVHELPSRARSDDPPGRRDEWLIEAIPRDRRQPYKVRAVIESAVDAGSYFEMGAGWGKSAVTGFARLAGWPVAVLASDQYQYAGGWTADASLKLT